MHLPPVADQSRSSARALAVLLVVVLGGCGNSGGSGSTPGAGGNGNGAGNTGYRSPKIAPHEWRLRFREQPDSGLAGLPFGRPIEVEILEKNGAIADVSMPVELVVQDPAGTSRLGGSVLVSSRAGVAVFSDLTVSSAGRDLTLLARSPTGRPAD